jgi:hypothetical protein
LAINHWFAETLGFAHFTLTTQENLKPSEENANETGTWNCSYFGNYRAWHVVDSG